jgi:thiaminase/transcriptional activator TenA
MSNWFNQVRENTDYILEAIKKQSFITELLQGTLSEEIFQFYIHQDVLYLQEYKKVLAMVGLKCTQASEMHFFLEAATEVVAVENEMHQLFLKNEWTNKEASPACELYTSYLTKMAGNYSVAEGLAAVLPCFTIYQEIGAYILANQKNKKDNPYQNWIQTYGGEEFSKSVMQAIQITNNYALKASDETVQKMNNAFKKSSKLEWMFWESAYNKEQWKI